MKPMKIKFRAECLQDVLKLLKRLLDISAINGLEIQNTQIQKMEGIPDVECEIDCGIALETMRLLMERQRDSHVMRQTAQYSENYTGKRDYNL
jgi:hypothetical protein